MTRSTKGLTHGKDHPILTSMEITAPQQEGPERMSEKTKAYTATPHDVAEIYGVSARNVRKWAKDMEVPFRQTPSGPRFNLVELDQHFRPEPIPA